MEKKYKPVIGLEIHVELSTKSKMFCQCSADYFGKKTNTNVCPVCLGMPGALPVPNRKAIQWMIKIGQALNCKINKESKFDRKHYFYPDLAKGYQISQYDEPFAINGHIDILSKDKVQKKFGIRRVHMEEDTGKLIHSEKGSLVNFNRSGVPLVEIVTEADFDNSDDVKQFLEELQTIIRYLDVSDADMEKGSMRLEPNISVRLTGEKKLPPYKVEVKNINSFNFVKKAIDYEVKRHIQILEKGEYPKQETRGYNEGKGITISQRSKEEAEDYRYFPEPDIPPIFHTDKQLNEIRKAIPELPQEKLKKYTDRLNLRYEEAFILTRDKALTNFYEEVLIKIEKKLDTSKNDKDLPDNVAQNVANFIVNKKIPTNIKADDFVKKVLEKFKPKETDTKLLTAKVEVVIKDNPKVIEQIRSGKENAIMFLVGQVMREMKGQAEAGLVKRELQEKIYK